MKTPRCESVVFSVILERSDRIHMNLKIKKLLEEYKNLAEKLNEVNQKINDSGADGEDIIPGHDEGADYWALMTKYKIYMEQARNIKKQLNDLGYNKV